MLNVELRYWLNEAWEYNKFIIPKNNKNLTKDKILNALSNSELKLYEQLGYARAYWDDQVKPKIFNNKEKGSHLIKWILKTIDMQLCPKCKEVQHSCMFNTNQCFCTRCNKKYREAHKEEAREASRAYVLSKRQRMPWWVDRKKLREMYKNKPIGYHVDHIIPLNGDLVSGLHIPENLQYLTPEENLSKGNRYVGN